MLDKMLFLLPVNNAMSQTTAIIHFAYLKFTDVMFNKKLLNIFGKLICYLIESLYTFLTIGVQNKNTNIINIYKWQWVNVRAIEEERWKAI